MGKTAFATSMLIEAANELQYGKNKAPYIVKVGTVDACGPLVRDNTIVAGVPILIDECKVGETRGTRGPMTLDDAKAVTEVRNTTTVNARYADFQFATPVPRIFTYNGKCPNSWHYQIPLNVLEESNEVRMNLNADIKAVLKRCAFATVTNNLISAEVRAEYDR